MDKLEQNENAGSAEEQLFIMRALRAADKAERIARMKRIGLAALAVGVAAWLAFKAPGPQFGPMASLIILLLAMAACTAKVIALNDKNTRVILQSIAQLERSGRSAR